MKVNDILEVDNLKKSYMDFTLDNVSFSIPYGTIMGLIGENGAGKTTTINLILDEIKKDSGNIKIFGKDSIKDALEVKENIGVVFDECLFPDLFNIKDIENFLKDIYSSWKHETYAAYIKQFQLPIDKTIKDFSKGMKMKLSIAVALAHNPQLLILDEATSGLDPIMRDEMLDILLEFVQDETHAVLFSSHITSDLEKVADYITFIHKGKVLFTKTKDELIYKYGIIKCGTELFKTIEKKDIIAYRKQDYEWQVLVSDKDTMQRKYKGSVCDRATIDEIMLFFIKGDKK